MAPPHSPHELKGNAEMVAEVEVLNHVNNVVLVVTILNNKNETFFYYPTTTSITNVSTATDLFSEHIQDFDFHQSLMVEALLVPDDLDGHRLTRLVIKTLHTNTYTHSQICIHDTTQPFSCV